LTPPRPSLFQKTTKLLGWWCGEAGNSSAMAVTMLTTPTRQQPSAFYFQPRSFLEDFPTAFNVITSSNPGQQPFFLSPAL